MEWQDGITAGDIWSDVSNNIKYTGKVMVAVNHEYVDMSHLLYKNDEVAFFPPVTGG
jgi:molybdopterin converting factor small subunit